jgi:hypothetical protein
MIDLATKSLLSLAQAAKILPAGRNGKKAHPATIFRWIAKGAKDPDGQLVRLDGLRVGGRWLTSKEALQRFAERLTPELDRQPAFHVRTARQRQLASERAGRELERLGI